MVRYGSWSNTKKRTVKINGSVRFTLLTVSLKNGTVTVAIAVKKTENGPDTVGYTVRYTVRLTHIMEIFGRDY